MRGCEGGGRSCIFFLRVLDLFFSQNHEFKDEAIQVYYISVDSDLGYETMF